MSKTATLRVCASCEWIYKVEKNPGIFKHNWNCLKCSFISYGARYVYGNACYRYQYDQQPWIEKKVTDYWVKLNEEVDDKLKKPLRVNLKRFFNKPAKKKKTVSKINQKKYLREPIKCPFCGSENIHKEELWPDNDEMGEWANRDAKCLQCGKKWRDIYKLAEVQDLSHFEDMKFREDYVKDFWEANKLLKRRKDYVKLGKVQNDHKGS